MQEFFPRPEFHKHVSRITNDEIIESQCRTIRTAMFSFQFYWFQKFVTEQQQNADVSQNLFPI
jgi:hypothetical protein